MPRPGADPVRGLSWIGLLVLCGLVWTIAAWLVWWAGGELCEAMAGWCEEWE